MKNKFDKKKFLDLVSKSSPWVEKAKWRIINESWLDKSAQIAVKILRFIRENKISQVELAEAMGVSPQQISKILKGSENLTLETITKIENSLGISIVEVSQAVSKVGFETKYKFVTHKYNTNKTRAKSFDYNRNNFVNSSGRQKSPHLKLAS